MAAKKKKRVAGRPCAKSKAKATKKVARRPATKKAAAKKSTKKSARARVAKKVAKKASAKATARKATAKPTKVTKPRASSKALQKKKKAPAKASKAAAKVQDPKKVVRPARPLATRTKAPLKAADTAKVAKKPEPQGDDAISTEDLWGVYRTEAAKKAAQKPNKVDALRNILIERHYPLVRYIAERLLQTLPKSIELDDLVSAGLFGLMDAIRGFDVSRGIKFKTYCSTRIRGAILDQLRSQDWVPRLVRLKASRIERALQKLTAEYGREPTHAELARSLDMDHTDLNKEIQDSRAKTMFSLSEKWEDDEGSVEKVEVLEDKTAVDPVTELNRRDLMGFITRALTHKERFIIEQYYQYGHTMREIGEMLALTESRVCQIHSNVMGRLKGLLGQKQGSLLS
jgi:RNA polymerase sigma factor for flagellar operon FliA